MEHRGIWAAVGACLIAGALVAPPGSALSPQRLIADALQPIPVPTASAAPSSPVPELPVAVPDHPELAPVVPVLVEAAPRTTSAAPTATADSVRRTQPRSSTPPTTSAPKPSTKPPVTQPPKATPTPSSPPPASTPKPIKRPDKRGSNPVKPGPPVTKGVPKSNDKAGTTAFARTYAVTVKEPTGWYGGDRVQQRRSTTKATPAGHARHGKGTWRAMTCDHGDHRRWTGQGKPTTWGGHGWHGGSRHASRVSW